MSDKEFDYEGIEPTDGDIIEVEEFDENPTQELPKETRSLANVLYHVGCALDELNSAARSIPCKDVQGIDLMERTQDRVIQLIERFSQIRDARRN